MWLKMFECILCTLLFWYVKGVDSIVSVNCIVNGSQSSANTLSTCVVLAPSLVLTDHHM